ERLGISSVVVLEEDLPRLRALRDDPRWSGPRSSPPFAIFVARTLRRLPQTVTAGHLRLDTDAPAGTWLAARIAFYPLWSASLDGRPIATRRGELGDLEVRSPGPGTRVDLVYARGIAETAGLAISALSAVALVAIWSLQDRVARSSRTSRSKA